MAATVLAVIIGIPFAVTALILLAPQLLTLLAADNERLWRLRRHEYTRATLSLRRAAEELLHYQQLPGRLRQDEFRAARDHLRAAQSELGRLHELPELSLLRPHGKPLAYFIRHPRHLRAIPRLSLYLLRADRPLSLAEQAIRQAVQEIVRLRHFPLPLYLDAEALTGQRLPALEQRLAEEPAAAEELRVRFRQLQQGAATLRATLAELAALTQTRRETLFQTLEELSLETTGLELELAGLRGARLTFGEQWVRATDRLRRFQQSANGRPLAPELAPLVAAIKRLLDEASPERGRGDEPGARRRLLLAHTLTDVAGRMAAAVPDLNELARSRHPVFNGVRDDWAALVMRARRLARGLSNDEAAPDNLAQAQAEAHSLDDDAAALRQKAAGLLASRRDQTRRALQQADLAVEGLTQAWQSQHQTVTRSPGALAQQVATIVRQRQTVPEEAAVLEEFANQAATLTAQLTRLDATLRRRLQHASELSKQWPALCERAEALGREWPCLSEAAASIRRSRQAWPTGLVSGSVASLYAALDRLDDEWAAAQRQVAALERQAAELRLQRAAVEELLAFADGRAPGPTGDQQQRIARFYLAQAHAAVTGDIALSALERAAGHAEKALR